jgi:CubicO group peptidase (beta-lactamase class C family)
MKKALTVLLALIPIILHSQFSGEGFRQLEDSVKKIMDEKNIPGVQFAITSRDTTLWLGNLGYADIRRDVPVTATTMFRIGSVTKSFTAVATMLLVERGLLSLDDALKQVAPGVEFENPWEDTDPVTIAHLLEHTTGFDDIHLAEYVANAEGWTNLECLQYHPDSRTSRWKPGMHSSYCNSGPVCVGVAIEEVTGMAYEEFVENKVFLPLGMEHSNFFNTDYTRRHLSVAYKNEALDEADYWHILGRPSGAINSTAEEMAKYIRFFLNRGMVDTMALLSEASIERIEHPRTTLAAKAGFSEGYGLNVVSRSYKGVKLCGHNGGLDGFLTAMGYFPDLGFGYVFMINNSGVGGFSDINRLFNDFVVPDSMEKEAREIADTTITVNTEMPGWYHSATSRAQIGAFAQRLGDIFRIIEKDGKYYYKEMFTPGERVYPIGQNILIKDSKGGRFNSYVFVTDDEGNAYIQVPGYGTNYAKTSGCNVWISMALLFFISLMIISVIVAALIWGPVSIFGKRKYRFLVVRIMPLLAVLFLVASILPLMFGITSDEIEVLGTLTLSSFSFFFFSILFALASLTAFFLALISLRKKMNKLARLHAFLVSLCLLILTVYLVYYDMIGLRLWAY